MFTCYMYTYVCTVYSRIEAWASISFLALETRFQNETGASKWDRRLFLCSTILAPGCMSSRSATRAPFSERVSATFIAFSLQEISNN